MGRPSDERRARLREAEGEMGGEKKGVPLVNNFFSIDRYYAVADKVLASFYKAFEERRLDDAFVLGKRFAIFSMDALPQHSYYRASKYADWRKKNSLDMQKVVIKLEQVAKWMDEEELERKRRMEIEKRQMQQERSRQLQARIRQQEEQERLKYKELQDRILQLQTQEVRPGGSTESALRKLEQLQLDFPVPSEDKAQRARDSTARRTSGVNRRQSTGFNDSKSSRTTTGDQADSGRLSRPQNRRKSMESDNQHGRSDTSRSSRGRNDKPYNSMDGILGQLRDAERLADDDKNGSSSSLRYSGQDSFSDGDHRAAGKGLERARRKPRRPSHDDDDLLAFDGNQSTSSSSSRWSRRSSMSNEPLPPPIPPPNATGEVLLPPPPSYNQVVGESRQDKLARISHLFPSGSSSGSSGLSSGSSGPLPAVSPGGLSSVRRSSIAPYPNPAENFYFSGAPQSFANRDRERERRPLSQREDKVSIRKLRDKYTADYRRLKQERLIDVFGLNTYQGRLRHSTNGCTVISPLVVSRHLNSRGSVSDDAIVDVIDNQCGPILRDIRNRLELDANALIIPSDVHDYLVDRKILSQSKFIDACGGNILDRNHIGEFLKLLDGGDKGKHVNKRTGAALFFHEHVVSIVKVPFSREKFCFDLVDSMPGMVDSNNRQMATRTRCRDLASFEALLRWYACGKFSESNCKYIDQNDWEESMADFDPRVFQAFVWAE